MKNFVIFIMVFSFLLGLTAVSPADGPRINFQRLSHDYGKVFSGQTVSVEFEFSNNGKGVLKIEGLTSSCGCTKALEGSKEIPPNGSGKIFAEFDTAGLKAGRKQKSIFVRSNDPVNPVVKLTFLADVVKELNLHPVSLSKRVSSVEEPVVFKLELTDTAKKSYRVLGASTVEGQAQIQLDPPILTLKPEKTSHLMLALKLKPEPNRSFYAGRIKLTTDHPYESEIEIPFLIKMENTTASGS